MQSRPVESAEDSVSCLLLPKVPSHGDVMCQLQYHGTKWGWEDELLNVVFPVIRVGNWRAVAAVQ